MLTLKRPYAGRIITGVARGFAEQYRVPVLLVRVFLIAAVLVSPVLLLVYLLLSISIPDERKVASSLQEREPKSGRLPRAQFEQFAIRLFHRLLPHSARTGSNTTAAILLLILAALLELPHVEGVSFYWAHPVITSFVGAIMWISPIAFYLSAASLFVFGWRSNGTAIIMPVERRARFMPDPGSSKMLGGIASGFSRVLLLDPAYIRVLWIALNVLTLGLAGIVYLLVWYLQRSRQHVRQELHKSQTPPDTKSEFGKQFRFAVAMLLVLLGVINGVTQTRLFFFNQQFFQGIAFALIGIILVWRGAEDTGERSAALLLLGSSIFLVGIYFFASTIGHFQVDSIDRFEIAEIIGAIGFGYLGITVLTSYARRIAFYFTLAIAVSAAMIAFHFARPEYLVAIVRFYEFFYPIIFAALGLWITFDP